MTPSPTPLWGTSWPSIFIYLSIYLSIYISICSWYIYIHTDEFRLRLCFRAAAPSLTLCLMMSWPSISIYLSIHPSIYLYIYMSHRRVSSPTPNLNPPFVYRATAPSPTPLWATSWPSIPIYPSIYLFIFYLSIYLSIYLLSIYLSIYLRQIVHDICTHIPTSLVVARISRAVAPSPTPLWATNWQCVSIPIYPSIYLPIYLAIYLLSIYLSI